MGWPIDINMVKLYNLLKNNRNITIDELTYIFGCSKRPIYKRAKALGMPIASRQFFVSDDEFLEEIKNDPRITYKKLQKKFNCTSWHVKIKLRKLGIQLNSAKKIITKKDLEDELKGRWVSAAVLGAKFDCSHTWVNHWLKVHGLHRKWSCRYKLRGVHSRLDKIKNKISDIKEGISILRGRILLI